MTLSRGIRAALAAALSTTLLTPAAEAQPAAAPSRPFGTLREQAALQQQ